MASTNDPSDFIEALLPDSKFPSDEPDEPDIQGRRVSKFFDIVRTLREGATVVRLEYWGWNESLTKLHHFLCATIQLPGDTILKAIIERKPSTTANNKELAKSQSSGARDYITVFRDDHPIFSENKKLKLRYARDWDAADRPTLLVIAAVAKTVSTMAANYNLYETQCIWYAFTVFHLVPPVTQKEDYPVVFTRLESIVKKVMKKRDIPQFSATLKETLEKYVQLSTAGLSTSQVGLVVKPINPLPSASEVAVVDHSCTDSSTDSSSLATALSTDLSSGVESTTTIPTPTETATTPELIDSPSSLGLTKAFKWFLPQPTKNDATQLDQPVVTRRRQMLWRTQSAV